MPWRPGCTFYHHLFFFHALWQYDLRFGAVTVDLVSQQAGDAVLRLRRFANDDRVKLIYERCEVF